MNKPDVNRKNQPRYNLHTLLVKIVTPKLFLSFNVTTAVLNYLRLTQQTETGFDFFSPKIDKRSKIGKFLNTDG